MSILQERVDALQLGHAPPARSSAALVEHRTLLVEPVPKRVERRCDRLSARVQAVLIVADRAAGRSMIPGRAAEAPLSPHRNCCLGRDTGRLVEFSSAARPWPRSSIALKRARPSLLYAHTRRIAARLACASAGKPPATGSESIFVPGWLGISTAPITAVWQS